MSPVHVKVGGAWKQASSISTKIGGAWKTATDMPVKVGGAWKAGNLASGGFEAIATVTAAGGETSLSFTSIPQNYVALQIRGIAKDTLSSLPYSGAVHVRFNSDTGSNYARHNLYGTGSAVTASGTASATSVLIPSSNMTSGTGLSNIFSASVIDIHDYASTTRNKTVRSLSGGDANISSTDYRIYFTSGLWMSTNAVSTIAITTNETSFAAGTSFALYGIKGAA